MGSRSRPAGIALDGAQPGDGEAAMTFVVSTDEVDRHGDIGSVGGWRTQAYSRNPVFLWAHDYARPAIGRAVDVWKDQHSLMARIEFAPADFAREVAALYRGGFQGGVSVGFNPIEYEVRRDSRTGDLLGINFTEQELPEISAAPVPANQSSLRKALDGAPRMRRYYQHFDLGSDDASAGMAIRSVAGGQGMPEKIALRELLEALRYARR